MSRLSGIQEAGGGKAVGAIRLVGASRNGVSPGPPKVLLVALGCF
jgi:hypothetical protein